MNNRILNKCILGATLLLLAACGQDEHVEQVGSLPEGKCPLQIGCVTLTADVDGKPWSDAAPQTRVAENADGNSSHWSNGDKIKVQIGDGTPGTYTYQDGKLTVAEGDAPAYWTSKADGQAIMAWHTSSGNETVELGNQAGGFAYVLTARTTANFNTPVSLSFSHALAKVRAALTGDQVIWVFNIKIKTLTSCTLNADGTLAAGGTEGFIPMVKTTYNGTTYWEANVVPGHQITEVRVNDIELDTYTPLTPQAAKLNTMALQVGM